MQKFVLLFILFASANSAPLQQEDATILKYDSTNDGLGSYIYNFETSDGTKRREEGTFLKSDDPEGGILRVVGFFSYIGPDGVTYTVKYIADDNGFQPEGEHLPRAEQEQKPRLDIRFNDRRAV